MTIEEAEKACDALVEKYKPYSWMSYVEGFENSSIIESATQCAILHQTGIVEIREDANSDFHCSYCVTGVLIKQKLEDAKLILQTLKNRVK